MPSFANISKQIIKVFIVSATSPKSRMIAGRCLDADGVALRSEIMTTHNVGPLFVCHANCCRSVLAWYLYQDLCRAPARSAGLEVGERISDRAERMLREWGIEASGHRPLKLSRKLCDEANAIFVMGPSYLHRMVREYGEDLADKAYLFADPFTKPVSFSNGEYKVFDPSFDDRPTTELVRDFRWMRDRVLQIRLALRGDGPPLVPLREYFELCKTVDPASH
ncbi:MAG: hypothetical protein WB630_13940 [Candidatus Acidiferrales bacterium]